MKTTFKVIWISILSTIVTMLTHILSDSNYHPLFTIKTPIVDIPYLFLINVCLSYIFLTLIFIGIKQHIPTSKLTKGVFYTNLIAAFFIFYNLEPTQIKTFSDFLIAVLIILVPFNVYGMFLGYLSNERTTKMNFDISMLGIFVVMIAWLLFRGLYYVIDVDEPKMSNIALTILWLLGSGFIVGFVFSLINIFIKETFFKKLMWLSLLTVGTFIGYYLIGYSLDMVFYPKQYLKILFDIVSVLIGVIVSNLIFVDKKNA